MIGTQLDLDIWHKWTAHANFPVINAGNMTTPFPTQKTILLEVDVFIVFYDQGLTRMRIFNQIGAVVLNFD